MGHNFTSSALSQEEEALLDDVANYALVIKNSMS